MKIITKAELGRLLRLSKRSIDRRIAGGELPRGIRLGGAVRWDLATIERFIAGLVDETESVDSTRRDEVAQ